MLLDDTKPAGKVYCGTIPRFMVDRRPFCRNAILQQEEQNWRWYWPLCTACPEKTPYSLETSQQRRRHLLLRPLNRADKGDVCRDDVWQAVDTQSATVVCRCLGTSHNRRESESLTLTPVANEPEEARDTAHARYLACLQASRERRRLPRGAAADSPGDGTNIHETTSEPRTATTCWRGTGGTAGKEIEIMK